MQNNNFSNYPQNFDRTMPIINPTYDQHILKPPELNITNGRIPQRLLIDSSDRNCKKYPKPNNYVYQLNKEYKDIISIELVQGCIPYTGYIINENNDKLFLQENIGETVSISIPIGNYNANSLRTALQTSLTNATNSGELVNTYTVQVDTNNMKFTIISSLENGIFRLLNNCCSCAKRQIYEYNNVVCNDCDSCQICRKNNCNEYIPKSISKILGFDKVNFIFARGIITNAEQLSPTTLQISACDSVFTEDFDTTLSNGISFQNLQNTFFTIDSIDDDNTMTIRINSGTIDFNPSILIESKIYGNKYISNNVYQVEDVKYVILEIEHLEHLDSNNKNMDGSYGVIFFRVPHGENNIIVNGALPSNGIEKYFNPPLGTLDRLRIKFLTADGNLYDFNGKDHVLEFEIITLNSPGKYNTLITT